MQSLISRLTMNTRLNTLAARNWHSSALCTRSEFRRTRDVEFKSWSGDSHMRPNEALLSRLPIHMSSKLLAHRFPKNPSAA